MESANQATGIHDLAFLHQLLRGSFAAGEGIIGVGDRSRVVPCPLSTFVADATTSTPFGLFDLSCS